MTMPILHHYDLSPFSEKIRLAMGLKDLDWGSVKVEAVPPRPALNALTGGYRRVPVLQIGADIFCDTAVIFDVLERLRPEPTLYPQGAGLAKGLSLWWDRATWIPAIGVLVDHIGEHLPQAFLDDRREHYLGIDISKPAMAPMLAAHVQQMTAMADWLDSMLGQGHDFLTGDRVSAADLTCHHSLWLLRANAGAEVIDAQLRLSPRVTGWMGRVAALGHGRPTPMTPDEALAAARDARPDPALLPTGDDPSGLTIGDLVSVTPDDNARVPVTGRLAGADAQEIVLAVAGETGDLHVHFPRAGFQALPARDQGRDAA